MKETLKLRKSLLELKSKERRYVAEINSLKSNLEKKNK
jgi:hypothetical protein